MTAALCVLVICITLLVAQYAAQQHERVMKLGNDRIDHLFHRVMTLEQVQGTKYDHAKFEELAGKVDALRIAQGMKRG